MTNWMKTALFLAVAVVTAGLALAAGTLTAPAVPQGFERVGQEFYPEFADPLAAKSLRVVTYDEGTTIIRPFDVTFSDGRWRISPYGYPVDAADRLAKTAGSVLGIAREGLASRSEQAWARLGVVDPLSEDTTKLSGRGTRLTLKDAAGKPLADYIIGKPVDGQPGTFNVRLPQEKETYRAKVALDLSTQFADWINSELLDIAAADLRRIELENYTVDEARGEIAVGDTTRLTRDAAAGQWSMADAPPTEQVKQSEVNALARTLDGLKIIGVRPMPAGLNPDLSIQPDVIRTQNDLTRVLGDLVTKGFMPGNSDSGQPRLYGKAGQVTAVTDNGVAYDLYFGDTVSGSTYDLEFGEDAPATDTKTLGKPATDTKTLGKPDAATNRTQGRYLFVAARFVPEALGEAPQPPEGLEPDTAKPDTAEANEQQLAARAEYEAAKTAFEQRNTAAQQTVKDANERFKGWYYVLSTENVQELKLDRAALLEPKPTDAKPTDTVPGDAKPAEPQPSEPQPSEPQPSEPPVQMPDMPQPPSETPPAPETPPATATPPAAEPKPESQPTPESQPAGAPLPVEAPRPGQ